MEKGMDKVKANICLLMSGAGLCSNLSGLRKSAKVVLSIRYEGLQEKQRQLPSCRRS